MAATDGGRCEDDIAASRGRAERGRPTCYLQKSLSAVAGVGAVAAPCLLLFPCPPSAVFAPVFVKRTFNTPSQPSPAQTSPAVVVCREPLLSPPQHHYLLPQLPPTLPPTQGTYCTDSALVCVCGQPSVCLDHTLLPPPTTTYYLLRGTSYYLT